MPLYEYLCDSCQTSFEALIRFGASEPEDCPTCGGPSRRILSPVHFANTGRTQSQPQPGVRDGQPEVTSLTLPAAARLCWMDNQSAARLAAYKAGRGAEYDDTVAARKEAALQCGDNESSKPGLLAHSHSPLSDPVMSANRRETAQREKLAESATIRKGEDAEKD